MNAATEIEHAGADIDEARGHSAADVATGDPLLDASRLLRAAVDRYPLIAGAVAEVDAAIGRAMAGRREAERETRTHLAAIRRAVAGVERTLTSGDSEPAPALTVSAEPDGPSAVVGALRAASTIVTELVAAPVRELVSTSVDCRGEIDVHLDGRDAGAVPRLAAAARLPSLRPKYVTVSPGPKGIHVWLDCDDLNARRVRFSVILDAEPADEDLAGLRALCGAETTGEDGGAP